MEQSKKKSPSLSSFRSHCVSNFSVSKTYANYHEETMSQDDKSVTMAMTSDIARENSVL